MPSLPGTRQYLIVIIRININSCTRVVVSTVQYLLSDRGHGITCVLDSIKQLVVAFAKNYNKVMLVVELYYYYYIATLTSCKHAGVVTAGQQAWASEKLGWAVALVRAGLGIRG